MSRRRRKIQDNAVLALAGAGTLCYVLWQVISNNIPAFALLAVVAGIIVKLIFIARNRRRKRLLERADEIIDQHSQALAKQRVLLVRRDPYGKLKLEKWHVEIDNFIKDHIRPALTAQQQATLPTLHVEIARRVEICASAFVQRSSLFKMFSETMTPQEFEAYCAERLRELGWDARTTRYTGDQGVDVIAEKGGLRVVLQCKLYSGSVGNDAVQEIVAGKGFERADCCAVVSNRSYTNSAQELAAANEVLLLHYSDLARLEMLVRNKCDTLVGAAAGPAKGGSLQLAFHPPVIPAIAPASPHEPIDETTKSSLDGLSELLEEVPRKSVVKPALIAVGAILLFVGLAVLLKGGQHTAVIIDNRNTSVEKSRKHSTLPAFTTYVNEKFGFRIDYPKSFVQSNAEGGDSSTFSSEDGEAAMIASGANTDGLTIKDTYDNSIKGVTGELGYHRLAEHWFVVTWRNSDRVFYQKSFVGTASRNSFIFSFPDNQRSTYEAIVTKMEKSFRPGDLDQSW